MALLQASRRLLHVSQSHFSQYYCQVHPLAVVTSNWNNHPSTPQQRYGSSIALGPRAPDGLLVVSILGPPNAGKSTLFNRFLCKQLNKSYRLASEKQRRRKIQSKGRIGSTAAASKKNGSGAIVTDVPGTTRDRRECYGRIGGTVFRLVDTAGVDGERIGYLNKKLSAGKEKSLDRCMIEQTLEAAKAADLVLLMLDARVGVTSDLNETARWLRKIDKDIVQRRENSNWKHPQQVLVLANKLEGDKWLHDEESPVMDHLAEATRVGFGEALPISAEHGEGMAEIAVVIEELSELKRGALGYSKEDVVIIEAEQKLKAKLAAKQKQQALPESKPNLPEPEKPLQLAILGRPNVGKSTLVNSILGQERVIAGSTPGLTRDAILVEWNWKGHPVHLVDTAGIRKITQRSDEIEDLSVQDANRAMKVADVAVLVLDAQAGNLQRQEMAIADAVVKEGRALVVAANKMDLIVDPGDEEYTAEQYADQVAQEIEQRLPQLRKTPVVPMSSLTGENVDKLMPVVFNARDRWERTISTGLLNRWLADVMEQHPPPPVEGNRNTKIKYVIQTKGRPPTFLLFCNVSSLPPPYMRHLSRNFQDTFEMFGMEVRFAVKKSAQENPFEPKKSGRTGSGLGGKEARKKRMIQALKSTGAPPKSPRRKKKWKR